MALKLKIRRMTRRNRCHVPGCKCRNALKISRRDDVNGSPLFLCPSCIRDIHAAYQAMEAESQAQTAEINGKIENQMREQAEAKMNEAEKPEGQTDETETPDQEQPEGQIEVPVEKPKKPRSTRGKTE